MATKDRIQEKAIRMNQKLESVRQESRKARKELVDAIMCDQKDVLSRADISQVTRSLAKFFRIQKRLGTAFFKAANADAQFVGSAVTGPVDGGWD